VLRDLDERRLTTAAAAQLLGLEHRQVYRLLKPYRTEGPAVDLEASRSLQQPAQTRGSSHQGVDRDGAGNDGDRCLWGSVLTDHRTEVMRPPRAIGEVVTDL